EPSFIPFSTLFRSSCRRPSDLPAKPVSPLSAAARGCSAIEISAERTRHSRLRTGMGKRSRRHCQECRALRRAVGDETLVECAELADYAWIAGGAVERFVGQIDQLAHMEPGPECLEAAGSHSPVAIAPCPFEQIELVGKAFGERLPQLRQQRRVFAGGSGKVGVEISGKLSHEG